MSKNLNIVPEGLNKSTYFLLPLINLSRYSFGQGSNFSNTYLSYNGKLIVIIKDKEQAGEYYRHETYLTDFDVDLGEGMVGTAIVYSIPEVFLVDLSNFMDGKYSLMSSAAKELIRKNSGLPYKNPTTDGRLGTHKLLMVLDKSPILKNWIENQCDIEIGDQELLEKPHYDHEYIDIDTITP